MKRIVAFVALLFVLSIFGACAHTGEHPVKAPVSPGAFGKSRFNFQPPVLVQLQDFSAYSNAPI